MCLLKVFTITYISVFKASANLNSCKICISRQVNLMFRVVKILEYFELKEN